MKNELRSLELTDFSKFSNKDFSRLISVLPLLESSVLRYVARMMSLIFGGLMYLGIALKLDLPQWRL